MARTSSTVQGIIFSLIAGSAWGLAFLIPNMLASFTSLDITIGRYFMYGLYSIILFMIARQNPFKISKKVWLQALIYAFAGNVGYFFFLVLAIKYAGATVTTLVLGTIPIVISIVGNFIYKEFPLKIMLIPAASILIGVTLLSYGELDMQAFEVSGNDFLLGFACALIALGMWTGYGISNGRFLRENSDVSADLFSTIIGIQTLTLVIIVIIVNSIFQEPIWVRIWANEEFLIFIIGVSVLGIFASWVATWAWNHASARLSVSLSGMLLSFETIFGLLYAFIYYQAFPTMTEGFSIVLILIGVLFGIWRIYHYKFTLK
ncbi:DMT family transporter [Ornithinibacillus sp. 4-3]|uniref:DMT family transporter n=1 Tax=Ornithinibacillus sp. 4-3 TaxID=3231488 RepID=A0AB39HSE1_9BACI